MSPGERSAIFCIGGGYLCWSQEEKLGSLCVDICVSPKKRSSAFNV